MMIIGRWASQLLASHALNITHLLIKQMKGTLMIAHPHYIKDSTRYLELIFGISISPDA